MPVSKRLRFEILRRDNHACRYCGATAPEVKLTVDHVVPSTLGGSDDPANLVAACAACNSGKSSVPADAALVADVAQDALRWAQAMNYVMDKRLEDRAMIDWELKLFASNWDTWKWTQPDGTKVAVPRPADWDQSVELWLLRGMDGPALWALIPIAMKKPKVRHEERWRYYCGVVWRNLTELQEEARALIDTGGLEGL